MSEDERLPSAPVHRSLGVRLGVLVLLAAAAIGAYVVFGENLTLESLAERESRLREFQRTSPVLMYGIAAAIYVAVTGASIPGAVPLSMGYGWFFGFLPALILVSFSSTAGASLAFLLSRFVFGDYLQRRFHSRLESFNRAFEQDGAFYLFSLRLIPVVPFFLVNALMGLTKIRLRTFWWVSQIGMLPGTAAYVYAGSVVPSLRELSDEGIEAAFDPRQLTQILAAFVAIGLLPLVMRFAVRTAAKRMGKSTPADKPTERSSKGRQYAPAGGTGDGGS